MPNPVAPPKVLLMVSGGPDSATLASLVQQESATGTQIHAIYLRSGHPSDDQEIKSANQILQPINGKLEIIDLSPTVAALGNARILIHSEASILPFGNVIALGIAASYGSRLGASKIYIALHSDDADENIEYTDGYIKRISQLFSTASSSAPEIVAPFIHMRKAEVFKKGMELGTNYAVTWSCIRGRDIHCGECGACRARRRAFVAAGIADPTNYAREPLAIETVGFERTSA
jgi:7-cyano-7-deazaguanine synthase